MKTASSVIACVVDNSGSYVALAIRLAKEFKHVYYSNPAWQHSYPNPNLSSIGDGYEEIEVVDNVFDIFDKVDFWIYPDVYYGPFQEFLKSQGEIVWGSGAAEELELERDVLKKQMDRLGLPVNKWWKVQGMTDLREFLQDHSGIWVKLNKWRGLIETFFCEKYELVKPELDEIEYCKGIDAEAVTFICEEPIDNAVEIGYDGYCVDGQFPEAWLSGVEIKDKAYAGVWKPYKDLSPLITQFNTAMVDEFKAYGYRGFVSLENRIVGRKSYMTDFTARMPCPPGSIYLEMVKNLGAVMWAGANGEIIPAENAALYGVELLIESNWAIKHECPVYFPPSVAQWVKLKKCIKKDKIDYIIPVPYGTSDIGSIAGIGDTLQAASEAVKKVADQIDGIELSIRQDALDSAQEMFDKANSFK